MTEWCPALLRVITNDLRLVYSMKFTFSTATLLFLSACFAIGASLQSNLNQTITSARNDLATEGSRLYRDLKITGGSHEHVSFTVRTPSISQLLLFQRTIDCCCEIVTWERKRFAGKVEGCYVDMSVPITTVHSVSGTAGLRSFKVQTENPKHQ